jgi:hypothetical protein
VRIVPRQVGVDQNLRYIVGNVTRRAGSDEETLGEGVKLKG